MDENQDKIIINELKPFDKQVDDVLNGADTTSSHLEVLKKTPPLLRMVGVPNLPILMTAHHVKTITQENGSGSANYHGLSVDIVKKLPELLSDPVMIMDSLTKDDSIVIVTQTVDRENRPVIGAIKLNGVGRQDSKIISANILTSAYGKDNFQSFIERNIKQGSVLYVDKEKSQALSVNPGIQFPDVMTSLDFNTIIRKTNAFVNREEEKKSETTEKNEESMKTDTKTATVSTDETAEQKLENARAQARRLAAKTGEPYVTIEWSEHQALNFNDVMSLSEADKKLRELDAKVGKGEKNYRTRLHIDYVFEGKAESFEDCRFDIGGEGGGLVHNIDEFLKYDTFSDAKKRIKTETALEYFKRHITVADFGRTELSLANSDLNKQRLINKYVDQARHVLNTTTPFSDYYKNMPPMPPDVLKARDVAEKNEASIKADTKNATAQSARERVQQIRDEMVKTLLEHIEKNPTDWQAGWNNIAAGAPYNGKTNSAYRGMNALYLAVIGMKRGYKDTRWVTFNQAKELGASVKKGEKSSPVIFFEFYDRATKKAFDSRTVKDMTDEEKAEYLKENVYAVMKYSSVFNAEQCHNFPERKEIAMSDEERAKQNVKIEMIIANSSAPVRYDGGSRAYYSPGADSIHLPEIKAFDTMQDYYATALHEIAHSTGHEKRLNRDLSGGFGSESYAKEELRAELACVFMQMEQGIQLNGKHITNHAAYLNSWLEAAKKDTSVFFKAAADAQKIADYIADNYLQAADVAVTTDENAAQEQPEEQPERNPMADYLRAEQPIRSVASDVGERTWEQENIRDWYTSAYPNDEAGLDIHPNATFKDLREEVNRPNPVSVYGMLGEDSVVRERTFTRLAELSGSSYASIYSAFLGETAQQKLENARALAQRLATETGEPYVTIEWSEHRSLNRYDVMSLSEADKKLAALDAQEDKNEGYYKTKLHIDYVFEGKHNAYECCRFDIGSEGGGLVHHIDEFLKYDTFLDAEEREEAENALKYFKVQMDLSAMVDTAIASGLSEQEQFDVQSYVLAARGAVNSAIPFSTYKLPDMAEAEQQSATESSLPDHTKEGNHEKKLTLEQARNAMLDAQELLQNHYAVRIENVQYTDPEDGYEGEEPAQVIYTISKHGNVREWKTIPLDSEVFSSDLPNGSLVSYEPVEYEELEEIAKRVREPIQTYKDVLRAEIEGDTERRRSNGYYDQRVDDILEEHYRTEYGLFERNIENPKYLSGMLYADETFRGERVVSLTQDESGENIAIIAQFNGQYAVAEDYSPEDGRRWGKAHYFYDQKSAEEFRTKNFPSENERTNGYQRLAESKSPLGQEYARIKGENADSVVFYRVGDYYGVFGADAERVAEKLELTLTDRTIGTEQHVPMCGVPFHSIDEYADKLANKGESVIVADGTEIKAHKAKIDLAERRLREYADSLRRIDLEVGNNAQTDEYYLNQAREQIAAYERSDEYQQALREDFPKDFIDDSPQDMAEIPQNKPVSERTVGEGLAASPAWLKINLPNGAVGNQYGNNTLIRMPEGEYSHYGVFVPTKFIQKSADGKMQLTVGSNYTYRLNNDGRQVELSGRELQDSFAGKQVGKEYKRVAPSRKFAQGLENLEKSVPAELKEIPTWCCYRTRWNAEKGKKDKFIISPIDGKWTSSKEPGKWVTFDAAMKYARENNCEGLSVLLDKKYGITCIDLDKCIEAETGKLNERASKLVEALNGTYIERSTSGNGLHIFVKDDILKDGRYNMTSVDKDKGDLEVYDDKRIMSLTGDMYSKGNTLTRAGSAATVYLRQELGERRNVLSAGSTPRPTGSLTLSDGELVRWIQDSKQGSKFNDLYHGRGVSGNRSDDDAKLAHMLLYFNGGDKDQAFRIMRESGAYRPDKPDSYYRATIDKMNGKIEVYAKRPTFSADGPGKPKGKGPGNGRRGSQA